MALEKDDRSYNFRALWLSATKITLSEDEIFQKLSGLFADPQPGLISWWDAVRGLLSQLGFK